MVARLNNLWLYISSIAGVILTILTLIDPKDDVISYFLMLSYLLFALGLVAALGGSIFKSITNPSNLKKSGLNLVVVFVVFLISYVLSSGEVLDSYGNISPFVSKWSEVGLYMLYILTVIAIGSIVFSNVSKYFR